MKLTSILILAATLHAAAGGNAQTVSISVKDAPLKTVFREIEKQSGYQFFYNDKLLKDSKKITIQVKNASLQQVLDFCFADQPLTYSIVDKIIVVKQKEKSPNGDATNLTIDDSRLTIDITGKVTDADGNPLIGATVQVKGSNKGTTTGNDGVFVLKGVDNDATLEISFVGYETLAIDINNRTSIVVSLKINPSPLEQTQVIAYGTRKVREQTGNVVTVKSSDIEKQPVNNPLLALEGRVPGLIITQATGLPGSGVVVKIQGQNSIINGNDPLYVVDGVPYISQLLPGINDIFGTSGARVNGYDVSGNPLNYLNPMDIESIEILKDADATAIYGSRAANGAILITTKKGKSGKTKVNINIQNGWGRVTRKLDLLNTQQYLAMRHEAKANDNATIDFYDYDINGTWDSTRYTDWQKELIGKTSNYLDIGTSVSAGNANMQYLVGANYHRETSVFPGNFADQKGSMHFNLNNLSANGKFKMQMSGSYMVDDNRMPGYDLTATAISLPPDAPALYNSDGSLNWAPDQSGNTSWSYLGNPISALYNKYSNKTNNLVSNFILGYEIIHGLELRTNLGYTNLESKELLAFPLIGVAPENRPFSDRVALYGNRGINSWIVEPQANYKKDFGRSKLDALVGMTIQENNSNGQQLYGVGYNNDNVLGDINSARSVGSNSATFISTYKYNAGFARINYNWKEKYIINSNFRRDGSSRFGEKNRFHNFWSTATAWIFSNENFVRSSLRFLSFGKIRASYGTTGNDQIGDYKYLNLYSSPSNVGVPYQGAVGLLPTGLPNPYLQWEETRKLQFGIELGLFNNKVLLTTNYFQNRSSNELLGYVLPITTGFTSITENFPATVQNSGFEFMLTSDTKSQKLEWNASINLTLPKNKLIAFPNLALSSFASSLVIGEPITLRKVYHLIGVDPATGVYQFADSKGNSTFSPNFSTDRNVLINTAPTFYGGFQNDVSYSNVQLSFLFQYVKQKGPNYFYGSAPGQKGNQPTWVLDRWQKIGDIKAIQRYNSNSSIYDQFSNTSGLSDAGYADASFVRLKNISLSWQFPKHLTNVIKAETCRVYVQGQNLLTITNYKGLDPETLSSFTLPPLKVITLGIQIIL